MTTRVLMLETGGWGGICHYSYNLCKALASDALSVRLLTAEPYELHDLPHNFEVTTRFDANTSYNTKIKEVIKTYKTFQPDVIHIQSTFSARKDWVALAVCKMLRIPTVYTAHNILPHDDAEKNARGMKWAYGKLYAYSGHIIAHSDDSRKALTDLFAPSPQKVSVIPHGNYVFAESEELRTKQDSRRRLNLNTDRRYLLAFGTIRPYKGTEDLLAAFTDVAPLFDDVDLLIAGKPIGQDPQELIDLVAKLGLQDRVVFRPDYIDLEDIAHYFEASDIAVYPYHAIYQSGALQLAYAFARPVVATAVGAFPETVDDGQNGILVPAKDPAKFAQALTTMLGYPQAQLDAMGTHSRHLAETRYSWKSVAEKTTAIYRKLAAR